MQRSLPVVLLLSAGLALAAGPQYMYLGTYTGPQSKGIYTYTFDAKTGALQLVGLGAEITNPSFLTVSPNSKFLYAVTELGNDGKVQGRVTGYSIDPATAKLTLINSQPSGGGGSCHLVVDRTNHMLIVANYGSGSVASFPIAADGTIGASVSLMQHHGSSVDPKRQRGPHAHGVFLSADNRFVFVPDLGLDKIYSYRIDPAAASLTANDPPFVAVKPGAGPRHFAFHPSNRFAYAVDEMGSSVTAFRYDAAAGALTEIQAISTLPADFKGEDNSAEIAVDAKGRFLYASNRGDDSIAVFAIDPKTGMLRSVQHVSTQGQQPRNFNLDPSGRYLLAANQHTNNIVSFHVDPATGFLTPTGGVTQAQAPVCIQFFPPKSGGSR